MGEVNEDGQFLRMTFMVEQLLSSIKSCGGVYRPTLLEWSGAKVLLGLL